MFTYCVFDKKTNNEDGEYISFGIKVIDHKENTVEQIWDISTEENKVLELCAKCNDSKLDPLHLKDVVEDFIIEQSSVF